MGKQVVGHFVKSVNGGYVAIDTSDHGPYIVLDRMISQKVLPNVSIYVVEVTDRTETGSLRFGRLIENVCESIHMKSLIGVDEVRVRTMSGCNVYLKYGFQHGANVRINLATRLPHEENYKEWFTGPDIPLYSFLGQKLAQLYEEEMAERIHTQSEEFREEMTHDEFCQFVWNQKYFQQKKVADAYPQWELIPGDPHFWERALANALVERIT